MKIAAEIWMVKLKNTNEELWDELPYLLVFVSSIAITYMKNKKHKTKKIKNFNKTIVYHI